MKSEKKVLIKKKITSIIVNMFKIEWKTMIMQIQIAFIIKIIDIFLNRQYIYICLDSVKNLEINNKQK